jgi:hypothetical protein
MQGQQPHVRGLAGTLNPFKSDKPAHELYSLSNTGLKVLVKKSHMYRFFRSNKKAGEKSAVSNGFFPGKVFQISLYFSSPGTIASTGH